MKQTPCGKLVLYCDGKNCPITDLWFDMKWDCPAYTCNAKRVEKDNRVTRDLFWYL